MTRLYVSGVTYLAEKDNASIGRTSMERKYWCCRPNIEYTGVLIVIDRFDSELWCDKVSAILDGIVPTCHKVYFIQYLLDLLNRFIHIENTPLHYEVEVSGPILANTFQVSE